MTWFRRKQPKDVGHNGGRSPEGGVALDDDPVVKGIRRMSERCERLVAQAQPLGPDESATARSGYTYGQVYAMMAGSDSAADILGAELSIDSAQRVADTMQALGAAATAERAVYFFIGAVTYLRKQYGVVASSVSKLQA